jgi:hypothetical protein
MAFVTRRNNEQVKEKSMRKALAICSLVTVLSMSSVAVAADMFFYPTKGQSKEQQEKDEFDCYKWAKSQSGVDPMAPAAGPDRGARAGGTVKGAAKGAAAGALIGAIAGDAGKGAAVGAAGGGMLGRKGAKDTEKAEAASERNAYDRAVAACMEGRGYSVK